MSQEVTVNQPKKKIEDVDELAINDIETEASILSKEFYQLTLENEVPLESNICH